MTFHDIEVVKHERESEATGWNGELRPMTRWSLKKVLRFRGPEGVSELVKKAEDHLVRRMSFSSDCYVTCRRTPCWRSPSLLRRPRTLSRRRPSRRQRHPTRVSSRCVCGRARPFLEASAVL